MTLLRAIWSLFKPVFPDAGMDHRPSDHAGFGLDSSQPLGVKPPTGVFEDRIRRHLLEAGQALREAKAREHRARIMLAIALLGFFGQVVVVAVGR